MRGWTVFALTIAAVLLPRIARGQPATRPAAWSDIDQRLVFLTVQLASVETSIDAVEKQLKATGYKINVRKDDADRFRKGNELMDRNGGGPRRWQDFYGQTAEKFFYNPAPAPGELRVTATVLNTKDGNARAPRPADQRPPQYDYIYRANDNARAQAEADIAKLAGKVDQLLARRRQLEGEQSALWTKISFRAVAGREMLGRPMYRFDLKSTGNDPNAAQQLEALRAAMDFLRLNNKLIEVADKQLDAGQADFVVGFEAAVAKSRTEFDARLMKQTALILDSADRGTTIGKLTAVAKRMNDVVKNVADAYKLALDGDKAGDEQRKQTFRMQLQESLITYAEAVLAGDECIVQLGRDWRIEPDFDKPMPETKVDLAAGKMIAFSPAGYWKHVETGTLYEFFEDGTFVGTKVGSSMRAPGTWKRIDNQVMMTFGQGGIGSGSVLNISNDEFMTAPGFRMARMTAQQFKQEQPGPLNPKMRR